MKSVPLDGSEDIKKYEREDKDPEEIECERNRCTNEVEREADEDPERPENDPQNPAHDRVVAVERAEEIKHGNLHGKDAVEPFQKRYKNMRGVPRTVHVPVMKKLAESIEEPIDEVCRGEIHAFIVATSAKEAYRILHSRGASSMLAEASHKRRQCMKENEVLQKLRERLAAVPGFVSVTVSKRILDVYVDGEIISGTVREQLHEIAYDAVPEKGVRIFPRYVSNLRPRNASAATPP
jgi:hypothetical protein